MTQWDFYKRRLIRSADGHHGLADWRGIILFPAFDPIPTHRGDPGLEDAAGDGDRRTLIPIPISWDIRGWDEMHPLNGPAWSLFFEYIGNILYAVVVRRFSKVMLGIFVFLAAVLLVHFAVWVARAI